MGLCRYCNKPAGLFRSKHKKCEISFNEYKNKLLVLLHQELSTVISDNLKEKVSQYTLNGLIKKEEEKNIILDSWEKAIKIMLEDNIISEKEEDNLFKIIHMFDLEKKELNKHEYYDRLERSSILRYIINGKFPSGKFIIDNNEIMPFNLQKSEKMIYIFKNVDYYAQINNKEFIGATQGLSIPIANGVYYRVGVFKGKSVVNKTTKQLDKGVVGITNKHIYFSGKRKSFRINFNKIVSFKPYKKGIGIFKDTKNAQEQMFMNIDGWFIYNLLINLQKI